MTKIFTGEADNTNEANLTEERMPLFLDLQRELMGRFAKNADDQNAAALTWAASYSKDFRILMDKEPEWIDKYREVKTEEEKDNLLTAIERRLVQ